MNKKYLILGCLLLVPAAIAHADFKETDWRYVKQINLPSLPGEQYVSVKLDRETLSGSRDDLADLRIVSGRGLETGLQILVKSPSREMDYQRGTLLNLSERGGAVSFMLDLGVQGSIHDHVQIVTNSRNFRRQVSVYASDSARSIDDGGWRLLTNKGYVYNYYDSMAGFNAGSTAVAYPKSTSRYLKIVIAPGDGSLAVNSASVYRDEIVAGENESIETNVAIVQNHESKTTEITADLGTKGMLTHSITLDASSANFNRRAVVQESNDGSMWTRIEQGYIFNIATPLFTGKELTIPYEGSKARYIRVIVFNEDSAPVAFGSKAVIQGTSRYVVFSASPENSYRLFYGNGNAATPRYDLARFFQYIDTRSMPVASLGGGASNPSYVEALPPVPPFSERYPYILNGVLVLLVLVIGLFIYLYVRKIAKQ